MRKGYQLEKSKRDRDAKETWTAYNAQDISQSLARNVDYKKGTSRNVIWYTQSAMGK